MLDACDVGCCGDGDWGRSLSDVSVIFTTSAKVPTYHIPLAGELCSELRH